MGVGCGGDVIRVIKTRADGFYSDHRVRYFALRIYCSKKTTNLLPAPDAIACVIIKRRWLLVRACSRNRAYNTLYTQK